MSVSEGFADLRLNRQEGQINESFWPSFTDIMTVIVMIFLIAMVVLLIRNIELVRELRATMEAEQVASELARATGEEKQSLIYRLHQAQSRISELQLDVMRLKDREIAQSGTISQQAAEISSLQQLKDRKLAELEDLNRAAALLREQLAAARARISQLDDQRTLDQNTITDLQSSLGGLQAQVEQTATERQSLQSELEARRSEIDRLQSQRAAIEARYQTLSGEHDLLQTKYNRLIRPARSAEGRHLVEVRYRKEAGRFRVSWREGDTGPFQDINRRRLELLLTRLKQRHPEGLYVKIIFPERSGLSYNEAFEFTTDLHQRFDYYFQDKAESTQDGSGPAQDQRENE